MNAKDCKTCRVMTSQARRRGWPTIRQSRRCQRDVRMDGRMNGRTKASIYNAPRAGLVRLRAGGHVGLCYPSKFATRVPYRVLEYSPRVSDAFNKMYTTLFHHKVAINSKKYTTTEADNRETDKILTNQHSLSRPIIS